MLKRIRYRLRRAIGFPDSALAVRIIGHREYVGGMWEELGALQLDFLRARGLAPSDCLLDIGCGSLRAGRFFIEYLDPGCYVGFDKNELLIQRGLTYEVAPHVRALKCPEFVVSSQFEFDKCVQTPNFSIAQSLFTHLTADDVLLCLKNLGDWVEQGHTFFASFDPRRSIQNPPRSHSSLKFYHSVETLRALGQAAGWHTCYIGDWSHPRGLEMMMFQKQSQT